MAATLREKLAHYQKGAEMILDSLLEALNKLDPSTLVPMSDFEQLVRRLRIEMPQLIEQLDEVLGRLDQFDATREHSVRASKAGRECTIEDALKAAGFEQESDTGAWVASIH
jgi:hypothetical protein